MLLGMPDSILEKVLSSKHAEEIAHFVPKEIIARILQPLPSRDREIVTRRFGLHGGAKETLEEIGKTLEITRERVRQIEKAAVEKINAKRNASVPYSWATTRGSMTFPLDLEIFCPSLSRTRPWKYTVWNGALSYL